MAIRIITDTSSDYSLEEAHEIGISLVPMTINVGTTSYQDAIDLTHADFFEMLLSDGEAPKTSQPSPQSFITLFEEAQRNGDDIIAILISGGLSGTVDSALNAKALCGYDRIHIIDSRCATAGIHFLVNEALRMIAQNASVAVIVARLESLKSRIRVFLGLDTLKYLCRSGRLSKVEAGIGTLAGIHPLLKLENGKLDVCAKCMGSKKALRRLSEIIAGCKLDPAFPVRFIYSYEDANCQALMKLLPGLSNQPPLSLGPTLSAHTGPGVYGAFFVEAE